MKKDLLIGGAFVASAALCIAAIVLMLGSQPEAAAPKTIKSKPEPIALMQAEKEEPKKLPEPARKIPIKQEQPKKEEPKKLVEKKIEPKKEEPKVVAKIEPKVEPKKEEPKVVAKIEPKIEPKKEIGVVPEIKKVEAKNVPPKEEKKEPAAVGKAPDLIEFGDDLKKINRPNGEYAVRQLDGEDKLILLGKVKTLKLHGVLGRAVLDASRLEAQEIIVSGDLAGSANVKLFAPRGSVVFRAQIHGSATVEVIAPDGKVNLKNDGRVIATGGSTLSIVARDVELNGEILGGVVVSVILNRDGTLKFTKIGEGVHLHYGKANRGDPEPRITQGSIVGGARLRKIESAKK